MNREGAETYLRLLAEAAMRRALAASPEQRLAGSADPGGHRTRLKLVGQALAAVGALDFGTLEDILVDFNLAMAVRAASDPWRGPGQALATSLALHGQPVHQLPMTWGVRLGLGRAEVTGPASPGPGPANPGAGPGGPAGAERETGPDDAGRFVPVGLKVPFRDADVSGELFLMSFTRTRAGARFFAVWNIRAPALRDISLIPFGRFTVADDRGARYGLEFAPSGDSGWTSEVVLCPAPPPDARWLDVTAPGSTAVRVGLGAPDSGGTDGALASKTGTSPGEHLLAMIGERLLTAVPDQPRNPWRQATAVAPPALRHMAAGLGDIVGALEAADVLSPLSPVPARLATLCASLDIAEHGITAPTARQLPEPWLSVLSHYQRRKPEPVPLLEGYAAMTAALPELDGIGLTLLGLHHSEGGSSLYALARGQLPEAFLGPFGIDPTFPLSVWL
ncbi:MAG TPA: hypothetical protein VFW50_32215, partial [Streptosporangiaceae bacterium]|nr:hypothetical protein [Streptosporangiaceae bacterium]